MEINAKEFKEIMNEILKGFAGDISEWRKQMAEELAAEIQKEIENEKLRN